MLKTEMYFSPSYKIAPKSQVAKVFCVKSSCTEEDQESHFSRIIETLLTPFFKNHYQNIPWIPWVIVQYVVID